jgi:molybdenum cofactor cytidylyltransferase
MTMHETAPPEAVDRRERADPDLRADGGTDPVYIDPGELGDADLGERTVGGVVLAAGPGERYEGPYKLLETVDGTAMVRRAVAAMAESGVSEVVVIVGHEADAVREAIGDLDVEYVENPSYQDGQSTSLHLGVEVARERGWDATVFGLGDMPFVTSTAIDQVIDAYADGRSTIVAAGFEGKRGNPTLFDKSHYDALMDVTGDTGGRPVIMASADVGIVETDEPGVMRDIDTVEDYEEYV